VIKSSRRRQERHATCMKKMRNMYKTLNGNMKESEKLESLVLHGSGLKNRFWKSSV
jgi:hypothetical protein